MNLTSIQDKSQISANSSSDNVLVLCTQEDYYQILNSPGQPRSSVKEIPETQNIQSTPLHPKHKRIQLDLSPASTHYLLSATQNIQPVQLNAPVNPDVFNSLFGESCSMVQLFTIL